MTGDPAHRQTSADDRKLGDEWVDWDGRPGDVSADTDGRVFVGLAMATMAFILGLTALFGWLVHPRISQIGHIFWTIVSISYFAGAALLILWLVLFIWVALAKRPFLSTLILVPKLVNLLLGFTLRVGRMLGVPRDRLFNSFLKLHNLILDRDPRKVQPEKMLVLLPRCLTKEMNAALRRMRDRYGFMMTAAGGGGEARRKIWELRPGLVIAVACERDLLTGFIEVNPHIPVIGFPNIRPCGPCKNTEVDLTQIENTIKHHLISSLA